MLTNSTSVSGASSDHQSSRRNSYPNFASSTLSHLAHSKSQSPYSFINNNVKLSNINSDHYENSIAHKFQQVDLNDNLDKDLLNYRHHSYDNDLLLDMNNQSYHFHSRHLNSTHHHLDSTSTQQTIKTSKATLPIPTSSAALTSALDATIASRIKAQKSSTLLAVPDLPRQSSLISTDISEQHGLVGIPVTGYLNNNHGSGLLVKSAPNFTIGAKSNFSGTVSSSSSSYHLDRKVAIGNSGLPMSGNNSSFGDGGSLSSGYLGSSSGNCLDGSSCGSSSGFLASGGGGGHHSHHHFDGINGTPNFGGTSFSFSQQQQQQHKQGNNFNNGNDMFFRGYSATPPPGYTCKLCFVEGHWLRNCQLYLERKRGNQLHQQFMAELSNNPASALISDELKYQYQKLSQQIHLGGTRLPLKTTPPDGYICRKCNTAGHWIQQCPYQKTSFPPQTYTCRICGIKGHWIYQCSQKLPKVGGDGVGYEIGIGQQERFMTNGEMMMGDVGEYAQMGGGLDYLFGC